MTKTKKLCVTALGIALYVTVSMMVKIPITNHISPDLGYVVLAAYCWMFGPLVAAVVGAGGCFLVSLIATQWIAIGWPISNFLIGLVCGFAYNRLKGVKNGWLVNIAVTVLMVFIGVVLIKTVVECAIYSMPMAPKFAKNIIAFAMDAVTMCAGLLFISRFDKRMEKAAAAA